MNKTSLLLPAALLSLSTLSTPADAFIAEELARRAEVASCGASEEGPRPGLLLFSDETGTHWAALARSVDPDGWSTSGTTVYIAEVLAVSSPELSVCVSEREALDYILTHHNFHDGIEAIVDDSVIRLQFSQEDYGAPVTLSLTVDGEEIAVLSPVE